MVVRDIELSGYRDFVPIARSKVSEVYRAHQLGVDRPVAVKVLLLDDAEAVARFQRELELTVHLGRQHPHIVTVIDIGVSSSGQPCIVMEYYDNGSLHDRLRTYGPLPWSEVLAAGTAVADALSFAHRHGVLHRDVKPQNILVLPTSYVVADFGIARPIDSAHTSSVDWFSFRHAAPQVLDGEPPSVADDIWALGSTLFTLLDGRAPFAADEEADDTARAYMKRVRTGRRRRLDRPEVPPGLVAIIERCMRYEPADRFPDVAAVEGALRELGAEMRSWAPGVAGPRAVGAGATFDTAAPPSSAPPAHPPPPTPPPVAPPVGTDVRSPSALVHLPPRRPTDSHPSDRSTGFGYPSELSAVAVDETSAPVRPRRRWPMLVALGVVLGAVIGVAGYLSFGGVSGEVPRNPPGSGASLPASLGPNVNNAGLMPTITELEATGSAVRIRWSDPTAGDATFVVVRVIDNKGEPVGTVTPGTTQFLAEGLDPASAPYCFLVVAIVEDERGVSYTRCATP